MNLNHSKSLSATYKSELAIRALFEVIKLTRCEQDAIEFVHRVSQMAHLPQEVHDGIEWFNDERRDAAWEASLPTAEAHASL